MSYNITSKQYAAKIVEVAYFETVPNKETVCNVVEALINEYTNKQTKELLERVEELIELNNSQCGRINSDREVKEMLRNKINELKNANEWISVDKKTPFTHLSGNWDGLMSDEILVKDDKGIINVARCYTGIIDGNSFVDFYDNRDFELKNIIQWKKITN